MNTYRIKIDGRDYAGESDESLEQKPGFGSGWTAHCPRTVSAIATGEPLAIRGNRNLRSHVLRILDQMPEAKEIVILREHYHRLVGGDNDNGGPLRNAEKPIDKDWLESLNDWEPLGINGCYEHTSGLCLQPIDTAWLVVCGESDLGVISKRGDLQSLLSILGHECLEANR